ncbi:MAG: type II toxin-antitoxin system prevent-host-death family antitoxin, partial [Hyphomicrobiales bacterium]
GMSCSYFKTLATSASDSVRVITQSPFVARRNSCLVDSHRQAYRFRRRAWQAGSEIKDDLSRYLREAETQEIVITRHGRPAGVLIGFESEEDWFEYRLENDSRFLRRIEQARNSLRAGRGTRLEDLEAE